MFNCNSCLLSLIKQFIFRIIAQEIEAETETSL